MRLPKLLFCLLVLCAAAPARGAAAAGAPDESFSAALQRGTVHPSLYSFSDLYRLAVSGPTSASAAAPAGEAPVRTATAPAEVQFSVIERSEPRLGLLLLSGIALAAWVARRRLGYAI